MTSLKDQVDQSPYVQDSDVEMNFCADADTAYTIIPCLENYGVEGSCLLTLRGEGIEFAKVIPEFYCQRVNGRFLGNAGGGVFSLQNPQFQLFVSKKAEFIITLQRIDKESLLDSDGMMFMIVAGFAEKNKRKNVLKDEKEILFKSKYMDSKVITETMELNASPISYIIIPSREVKTTNDFELIIECAENCFTVSEIKEQKIRYKEDPCLDILDSYQQESSIFLKNNPVDEIVLHCKKTNCLFIDADFPPDEESVNNDPTKRSMQVITTSKLSGRFKIR